MRTLLIALFLCTAPALAATPPELMETLSRVHTLYIRGDKAILTLTGVKIDQSGAFEASGTWVPVNSPAPRTCGSVLQGQLIDLLLQFGNSTCSGRFTYKGGEFEGEVQINNVGIFPAKFSVR